MKKIVIMFLYLFVAAIVIVLGAMTSLSFLGRSLDKESKAYVDAAVPVIVSDWDIEEVRKRASPELNNALDYDELEEAFAMLQQLGKFDEYTGSRGEANIIIGWQGGLEITADYTASADFETGSVEIPITLIRHNGRWQILDLSFSPSVYSEQKDFI